VSTPAFAYGSFDVVVVTVQGIGPFHPARDSAPGLGRAREIDSR
jgi:hypothetical protein